MSKPRYTYRRELGLLFCIVDSETGRIIATCSDEGKAKLIVQCLNVADAEDKKKQLN